jgi:hypothetical protein
MEGRVGFQVSWAQLFAIRDSLTKTRIVAAERKSEKAGETDKH